MKLIDRIKEYFTRTVVSYSINESTATKAFSSTYDAISTLSRCIDLIINTAASVEFCIVEDKGVLNQRTTFNRFEKLLNAPDSSMSDLHFRKLIYRDLVFQGNAFPYNLGDQLQLLSGVSYSSSDKPTLGNKPLEADRLIHIRLLNEQGYQYGKSYLTRIDSEIELIARMLKFQNNFFNNNGFPGVVLETDSPLSKKTKERLADEFINMFSIMKGNSSKPFILDNSIKMKDVQRSFKDLQFLESIERLSKNIMSGLGIPSVIIDSGNNANIRGNLNIFIYLTIAPFVDSVAAELTRHLHTFYSGTKKLKVIGDYDNIQVLKDDFLKTGNVVKTLYTTGIINKNEARQRLGYSDIGEEGEEFITPTNITSAHYLNNAEPKDAEE